MNLEDLGLPLGKTVAMPDEFSPDHLAGVPGLGRVSVKGSISRASRVLTSGICGKLAG